MIKPTASQQTAINEKRYQHFVRFTLDQQTTLTIGEDEIWESGFKVDQAVSGRSAFELGACVVNQLKVEIYNPNGTYQNTDFLGKPVYAYIELYDTNNTTVIGTISKGHYIVTEADTNGQIVKLTCLDAMSTLDRPYTDVNTVYPATLYNIVNDIATLAGLTLSLDGVNWLPTGITSAYTVTVRPTDVNCRDVLSAVCQATGNYATIDRLGQLLITRYDTAFIAETGSDYSGYDYNEVDPSNLFSLTRDEAQVTLTGVSVEVGDDAYTAGTDDYMIHIVDNPVINSGSEQTFATALNTLVNGWNFRPFEADTRSNMCMEAGDNVVITDTLGNVYKSIVTHVEYEAGNKQNVECNADPAAVQSSKRYSEAAKAAAQTVKVYDSTVNNYIDLVSKGMGMYRSLITDPDDPTSQIYAFHDESTFGSSLFCMFENGNGIQVGRRDTTSDPWTYTSATVEDAVVLAQTLVANTAIINALFSNDVTVTGALHSSDYVAASPGASPPYSQAGMGLDFGDKEFEGENFAIDASGKLYANGAEFTGSEITGGRITLTDAGGSNPNLRIYKETDPENYGTTIGSVSWSKEWYDPNDPAMFYYYAWRFSNGEMIGTVTDDAMRLRINWQNGTIETLGNAYLGSLDVEDATNTTGNISIHNNSVARGTTPSSNSYMRYNIVDKNQRQLCLWEQGTLSNGNVVMNMWLMGHHTNSEQYGGLQITKAVDNTNNAVLAFNANTGALSGFNMDAARITSGALPIARGGTGATDRLTAFKNITNQNVGSNAQYFVTLTQNWASAGYSSKADVLTALNIKCPALWSGGLSTVNQQITFTWGGYNAYIIGGTAGGNYYTTVIIPANDLRTSQAKYLLSDEEVWIGFGIWYSGSTGYVKLLARSGNGSIAHVWGIN